MKKHWVTGILIGLGILIPIVALLVLFVRRQAEKAFAYDSVMVASGMISELYKSNPAPTQKEIDDVLVAIHDGSISHVMLDKDRKPMDLWGTPFRIRHEVKDRERTVLVSSAGPDRRFDTGDDITFGTISPANR
jgi:hypothetical protein